MDNITAIDNIRRLILDRFPPGLERLHWLSWLDAFVDFAEKLETPPDPVLECRRIWQASLSPVELNESPWDKTN
ncbi:MAG TPA: hypothetical protein VFA74_01790 [Terriglobales bacterium]|nr:hypothetical protein [Terriglobales bacterium]